MPTIHIHIDNASEALDMVATLLRDGYRITLDSELVPVERASARPAFVARRPIDELNDAVGMSSIEMAKLNRTATRANVKARIKASQARAAAFNAARDAEHAKHVDRTEMLRVHQERHMQAEEARFVACPKCGATEGEFCRRPGGHHGALFVHTARHLATMPVPATEFIPF